jgi:F-type H+-transporting ATPase subunit b
MKDARDVKDKIIAEAKEKANEESTRLLKNAREAIKNEKNAAISEMKTQMTILSIEIAEKILKSKLGNDKEQKELVEKLVDDIDLN